jgi:hypothetical protein
MIGQDFKTIVFFGTSDPQYQYIREAFSSYVAVKVFKTSNTDELDQILKQSHKTAVLINDVMAMDKLKTLEASAIKKASIRFYFLDHEKRLTREDIDKLSYRKVSTLINETGNELRKRLELYLMGRSTMFHMQSVSSATTVGSDTELVSNHKPMFFTHFKHDNNAWNMVASTHEQELDIETVLNRSWTVYYSELLTRAHEISEIEQDPHFSEKYHAILYPHSKIKALSLVHIAKGEKNFAELMAKVLEFLVKI